MTAGTADAGIGLVTLVVLVFPFLFGFLILVLLGVMAHHLYRIQHELERLAWLQSRPQAQPQLAQAAAALPATDPRAASHEAPTFRLLR